jgi:hypothetical protein
LALNEHSSDRDDPVPGVQFDPTVPNVARIYDYLLGGKNHFAADRAAAEELRTVLPDADVACRENRDFLRRAVRYLATEADISQFIDIGSGLPTADNTHEVAKAIPPDARVVYSDYDPIVVTHGHALLQTSDDVAVIHGDLRRPGAILGSVKATELIDYTRPVAVLLVAVLHFIADAEDPDGILGVLKTVMAPGSYLVISHVTQDGISREENLGGLSVYDKASSPVHPRRHDEVLRFFNRMELVDPGLVSIAAWRSHGNMRQLIYGGVARKP